MQVGRTAIDKQAWNQHHPIMCKEEEIVKQVPHILLTSENQCFYGDVGLDYLVAAGSRLSRQDMAIFIDAMTELNNGACAPHDFF